METIQTIAMTLSGIYIVFATGILFTIKHMFSSNLFNIVSILFALIYTSILIHYGFYIFMIIQFSLALFGTLTIYKRIILNK